jgi:hypothetical protein
MKSTFPREPSLIPYLAIATVVVAVVLSALIGRVEKATVPLEAHVARSIGVEPAAETALAHHEPATRAAEPFRPRG